MEVRQTRLVFNKWLRQDEVSGVVNLPIALINSKRLGQFPAQKIQLIHCSKGLIVNLKRRARLGQPLSSDAQWGLGRAVFND